MKRFISIFMIFAVLFSLSATAFADGQSEGDNSVHYDLEDGIIETPLEGKITVEYHDAIDSGISTTGVYTYTVTLTSKCILNNYYVITNWAMGPCTLTYTASAGETVSFAVAGSVSAEVEVPVAKLQSSFDASVGKSTTFTASESVQYEIPSGYKGRVAMRYYQDIYYFNWEKKLGDKVISSGSGSASTAGRDPYYVRQLISV